MRLNDDEAMRDDAGLGAAVLAALAAIDGAAAAATAEAAPLSGAVTELASVRRLHAPLGGQTAQLCGSGTIARLSGPISMARISGSVSIVRIAGSISITRVCSAVTPGRGRAGNAASDPAAAPVAGAE